MNEGANGDEDIMPNSPLSGGASPRRHKRQKSKFFSIDKSNRQSEIVQHDINEYQDDQDQDAKTYNILRMKT